MSLFKSLKSFANSIVGEADTIFKRVTSQGALERVVYAATLIGYADGDCDADEKAKMVQVIKAKMPQFDSRDINKAFKKASDLLDFGLDFGAPDVLSTISECDDSEEADLIVRVSILIGGADGDFDKDEQAMVRRICNAVHLDPVKYGL